ncbi:galactokinase [Demequina sp. B12]|uniref:galactokinase n=1 Tax=Demequina sp. B12 TaxID=2992757 RepID=UPI00237A709D|nr:galactokinase family protein [Demequina sp. B12]MDE0572544.1 galactokinase [Demequina sp. B12]
MADSPSAQVPLEWVVPDEPAAGATRVRDFFARTYGEEPAGAWFAPGRVILMGDHTDYNHGLALTTATPHGVWVAARARDDARLRIANEAAADLEGPDDVWEGSVEVQDVDGARGWPAFIAAAVWALTERGYTGCGLDVAVTSSIPVGAGLGGYGAALVATTRMADALWRLSLHNPSGQAEITDATIDAERAITGTHVGGIDQVSASCGADGDLTELDFRGRRPSVRAFPLPLSTYGLCLLVTESRIPFVPTRGEFSTRYQECAAAASDLGVPSLRDIADGSDPMRALAAVKDARVRRRARHVVSEIERVRVVERALSELGPAQDRFTAMGKAMFRSHASLAAEFDVSVPAIDAAVDAAWEAGAVGAKMFGAGLGGSSVALVRRTDKERIAVRIRDAVVAAGHPTPRFLTA